MDKNEKASPMIGSQSASEAPPPPAYSASSALPAYSTSSHSTLHTLDGTVSAVTSFHIHTHDIGIISARTLDLVPKENHGGTPSTPTFHTSYTGAETTNAFKITGMDIRHNDSTGRLVAHVVLTDETIVGEMNMGEHHIKLKPPTKSGSSKKNDIDQSTVCVEGLPSFPHLRWVSANVYLHPHKGKGKGGDAHLIDDEDRVFAIFLNQWNGKTSSNDLGDLCLTSVGAEILETVIASFVVVAERGQRKKAKRGEIIAETALLAIACSMM